MFRCFYVWWELVSLVKTIYLADSFLISLIYFWLFEMVSSLGWLLGHALISILAIHWCHFYLRLFYLWLWCCHLTIVACLLLYISFFWVYRLNENSICEAHRLSGVFLLGLQSCFCLARFPKVDRVYIVSLGYLWLSSRSISHQFLVRWRSDLGSPLLVFLELAVREFFIKIFAFTYYWWICNYLGFD